jgi:hypothetical protein
MVDALRAEEEAAHAAFDAEQQWRDAAAAEEEEANGDN